jgi:thymidylate kinase
MKKFKKIILVEGIDGSGKSTLCKGILESPQRLRHSFIKFPTRYPKDSSEVTADFYLQDFQKGLEELSKGEILLCDRSYLSTLVYQGFDNTFEVNRESYTYINEKASELFQSYCEELHLVWVYCSPENACERLQKRSQELKNDALDYMDDGDMLFELRSLMVRYNTVLTDRNVYSFFKDELYLNADDLTPEECLKYYLRFI